MNGIELSERFARVEAAFHELVELEAEERALALAAIAATEPDLAAELGHLFAAAAAADTPLDAPLLVDLGPATKSAGPAAPPPSTADGNPEASRLDRLPVGIPGYRVERVIGRGGSATVYVAEQIGEGFARKVALKIVDRAPDAAAARSFQAEQQILAALEHPGIARLYDAGTTPAGQPYLAMELVVGSTLLDHCRDRELPLAERLALFLSVLDAVEHAHGSGVVHRDLKPANIVVSERGEAKLLDFGIARLREAGGDTMTAHALRRAMTPAYASPEQVGGRPLGPATDVYSLGVVLYELLTDRRPYRLEDASFETLERAIREQDPTPPSTAVTEGERGPTTEATTGARGVLLRARRRRELKGDLDTIVLKALRKEPSERYASAAVFAADLRRFLDGRPILARRASRVYRLGKLLRRRRRLLAEVAVAAIALGLLAAWLLRAGATAADGGSILSDPNGSPWLVRPVAAAAATSYRAGLQALEREEIAVALGHLATAAERDPDQPLVRAALALARSRAGADARARVEGQRALDLAADLPRESRLLVEAVAYRTAGQRRLETDVLRVLSLLHPDNRELGLLFARALLGSGSAQEAIDISKRLRAHERRETADLRLGLVELDALNPLGRPRELAELAPPLVSAALERGLDLIAARALLQQGWALDAVGQVERSLSVANRARGIFAAHREPWGVAQALNLICIVRFRQGRYEEGAALCGETAQLQKRVGDVSGYAKALSNLGVLRQRLGQLTSARAALAQASELERRSILGDRGRKLRYLHNLANLDAELGNSQSAEESFREVIAIERESGDQLGLTLSLGALSALLQRRGAFGEAEPLLVEAEELGRKVGSARELGYTRWLAGSLAAEMGDLPRARQFFAAAAESFVGLKEPLFLARFEAFRAACEPSSPAICAQLEDWDRKLVALGDATSLELGVEIVRCHIDVGALPSARRALEVAISRVAKSEQPDDRAELLLARGAYALATGQLAEAAQHFQNAEDLAVRTSLGGVVLEARLFEARLARRRGDHRERVRALAEVVARDAQATRAGRIESEARALLRELG